MSDINNAIANLKEALEAKNIKKIKNLEERLERQNSSFDKTYKGLAKDKKDIELKFKKYREEKHEQTMILFKKISKLNKLIIEHGIVDDIEQIKYLIKEKGE